MRPLLVLLLAGLLLGWGCAQPHSVASRLPALDRARFEACRPHVTPWVCPEDRRCAQHALALYANTPAGQRRRWLLDYRCPDRVLTAAEAPAQHRGVLPALPRAAKERSDDP